VGYMRQRFGKTGVRMIAALLWLFNTVVQLLIFLIFAVVIMSWLVAFNVVNPRNRLVWQIDRALHALTDPILAPIRRIIPAIGGLDISPLVAALLLGFIQQLVNRLVINLVYGGSIL
jgi:YggT family protein